LQDRTFKMFKPFQARFLAQKSWIPIQSGSSHFHAMGLWFLYSHFWKCLFLYVFVIFLIQSTSNGTIPSSHLLRKLSPSEGLA
jgi:hypothetical protein